jgi:hypothetical protein
MDNNVYDYNTFYKKNKNKQYILLMLDLYIQYNN